ncbi:MAG: hypothetical protein ACQESC_00750 [Nanobdellota archaeon]
MVTIPDMSKQLVGYGIIFGFIMGLLIGILLGNQGVVVLVTAVVGIIIAQSKFSIGYYNTLTILTIISFLLGIILFTTAVSGFIITIVFALGLFIGKTVKKRF